MGFLDQLKRLFKPPVRHLEHCEYVRCDRCGETLTARINLRNDLSLRYGEGREPDTYFCRKGIVGSGLCFQKIEIELTYDKDRNLLDKKINGGTFINKEDYEESTTSSSE